MNVNELFLAGSMLTALLVVRFGVPIVCTWAFCSIVRHFTHAAEQA
jgi:hypothetical protein